MPGGRQPELLKAGITKYRSWAVGAKPRRAVRGGASCLHRPLPAIFDILMLERAVVVEVENRVALVAVLVPAAPPVAGDRAVAEIGHAVVVDAVERMQMPADAE